jgi:hypothetical protein
MLLIPELPYIIMTLCQPNNHQMTIQQRNRHLNKTKDGLLYLSLQTNNTFLYFFYINELQPLPMEYDKNEFKLCQ